MGFNPPVPQQDSDWEIRVAVLVSLLLQVFLIFVGPMRKRSSSPRPRFTVWSCYLLADWVADLALGLLLNNMGNIVGGGGNSSSSFGLKRGGGGGTAGNNNNASSGSSSPIIFAFWTPFLLLHLGGPDTITAYSLEDNELWLRHLIGLLFELFSACVIFFCSLHGNPMIHATVLMFVVGIIKYGERTYSLYSGSVDGFRNKILDPPEPGPNYAKLMTEFDSKKKAGLVVEIDIANGEAEAAHKEMEKQETTRLVLNTDKSVEARAYEFFLVFRRLFVNLILSFKERRQSQAFFLERPDMKASKAFEVIEVELNFIYDMVYTKAPVAYSTRGWVLRGICSCCLVSALVIFFFLDKPGHQILPVDVGITYALLLGGLALDVSALLMIFFSNRAQVYLESSRCLRWLAWLREVIKRWRARRWSGKTSQLNLIEYCLGKPGNYSNKGGRRWLHKIAEKMHVEEIVDDFVFIKRVPLRGKKQQDDGGDKQDSPPLLDFIFEGLKPAAEMLKAKGKGDIMEMCNCRGNRVIQHHATEIKKAIENNDEAKHLAMDKIKKSLEEKDEAKRLSMDDIDKIKADVAEEKFRLILDSVEQSDFDESLLLWHIATDLCGLQDEQNAPTADEERLRPIGETLSEYMLYLLIKQPEMLAATAGIGLLRYRDTCEEARRFFGSMEAWIDDHDDARKMLLSVNTSEKPLVMKGDRSKSVLFDGVILAKELRNLHDELKWEVITGVWGEMLTYAAGKCRGSMHVRQLSRGGELITLVWFLMAHMGLGDMYQIQEGDAKAKLIVKDQ
ncbi:unnamed protein product [Miscanthus lutarioriparius]|uniref:DUF4220 domain-containing protein n=1 Tax=Miscanthus lutarioriparius TaxID=422564 RepID=A0A811NSH5_9POAL|nr:unnamed protein product [Miscanthus lutarioriparius]